MANQPENNQILRMLRKQASAEDIQTFSGPSSSEDVDAAFSEVGIDADNLLDLFASPFESEDLDQETIEAYAMDRCSDEERRMVDAMIEIDPRLRETIAMVKREIEAAQAWSPPAVVAPKVEKEQVGLWAWLSRLFRTQAGRYALEGLVSVGAAAALTFVFISSRPQSGGQNRAPSGQLDPKMVALLDKDKTLTQELKDAQSKLAAQGANSTQVIAKDGDRSIISLGNGHFASEISTKDLQIPTYQNSNARTMGATQFALGGVPDKAIADPTEVNLSWRTPKGAEHAVFFVTVYGKTLSKKEYKTTEPTFSLDKGLLKPGELYFWYVTALADGKKLESSHAEFRTLSSEQIKVAASIRSDKTSGHLVKAAGLAKLGLQSEALAEFEKVTWQDPKAKSEMRKALFGK